LVQEKRSAAAGKWELEEVRLEFWPPVGC